MGYHHHPFFSHDAARMHHWYHRGPSRLLWFIFGAGAATLWIRNRECQAYNVRHCSRNRIPAEAYPPPAQAQAQAQAPFPAQPQQQPQPPSPPDGAAEREHWHHRRWEWHWPPKEVPQSPPAVLPAKPADWEPETETQRLQKLTQQATETVRPRLTAC